MTRIGPSLVISGQFESHEETTVEGRIDGHVTVKGAFLTITPRGAVKADIRGVRVYVQGQVLGGISATERIELAASAQVEGSLSANQVVILEGARFNGGIDMGQRTIASRLASYRESHPEAVSTPGGMVRTASSSKP